MLTRAVLFCGLIGLAVSQRLVLKHLNSDDGSSTGKIVRPNITITTSERRVYVPKDAQKPRSSQFFHLIPSTPSPSEEKKQPKTELAPLQPTQMRSVHRISNTTYQMPADFLCEGLECSKGHQCTLAQPVCTPQDCSLKPACVKKLSEHCEKCRPPCVHAVLNLEASGGCHPCLCEVIVFRPPSHLVKRLEQAAGTIN